MNWVLIAVLGILILYTYIGWKKGMIRIVLSLAALIVTVLVTMALTPVVSKTLKEDTKIYTNLVDKTYKSIEKNDMFDNSFNHDVLEDSIGDIEQSSQELEDAAKKTIEMLPLPDSLKDKLLESSAIKNLSENANSTVESIRESVRNYIAVQLADIIFQTLVFVIVFIVVYIIMQVIMNAANVISRLPIIHQVNKAAGLGVGALKGLIIIWIFFSVITILSNTSFARSVFNQINSNGFLTFLYNNNLIMKFILGVL